MSLRVLVTGGKGFLGSRVCSLLSASNSVGDVFPLASKDCDLRDGQAAQHFFAHYSPDIVIHCAGRVGGIRDARENPANFYFDNLLIGAHALHASYLVKVKKFVAIGSVCAYPEFAAIPLQEESLWDGYPEKVNAPYGMAKKMLIVQGNAYHQQYNFHSIHLLLGNLYGPGDNFNPTSSHVIPALIRKFVDAVEQGSKTVTLWGDGTPTREFLHVEDAARAIILATENYNNISPINIGSGAEISIHDLATFIAQQVGFNGKILWDTSMPNGQPLRKLDVSRASKEFGFHAKISLHDGIRETIDWFKQHRS